MILVPNCLLKSLKSIQELRRFNTTRHMPLCVVLGHQDELPSLQDQECITLPGRRMLYCRCPCGAGGKGGRTGVIDGPQITTNTGIKDKAFYWSRIRSVHSRKAEIIIFNNNIVTTFKLIYDDYNSVTIQLTILRAYPLYNLLGISDRKVPHVG